MTLATRQLPSFERFLPEPVECMILMYLSVSDLNSAILVSKTWNFVAINEKLWKKALENEQKEGRRNQLHNRLFGSLITAIQEKQYNKISRWISIGARIDQRYHGTIDREFSWMKPAAGHFENPTVLSIAANRLSGQEGGDIVRLLLHHHADPFAESKYHDYEANSDGYGTGGPPIEREGTELPSQSAYNSGIKSLLLLAEVEKKIILEQKISVGSSAIILRNLENAVDERPAIAREYLEQIMELKNDPVIRQGENEEEKTIDSGIGRQLTKADQEKLLGIEGFQERYQAILHPSFLQRYWKSLVAGGIGIFYSVCFYTSTMSFGGVVIGFFVSTTVPPIIAVIVGATIVGLISGLTYTLLMKLWDYYNQITLNSPQSINKQSKFHSGLFPKPAIVSQEHREDKMLGIESTFSSSVLVAT